MRRRLWLLVPAVGLVGFVLYLLLLPRPFGLRDSAPQRTAFMEYRLAEARTAGHELEIRHVWVPLDRISPHLRRAVIVGEDARFYEHRGIDWDALREELRYTGTGPVSWTDPADLRAVWAAVRYYRENRERIRGRSTITQQLAKNLYFSPERSLVRKLREMLVARRLERSLEKDRILELYLNFAEWGPGIFGAEAAARHYFGRSAAGLSREQAAALAATLPHPLTSNPSRRPARMAWRQRLILDRMAGAARGEPDRSPIPEAPPVPKEPRILGVPVADTAPPRPDPAGDPPSPDTLPAPPRPDPAGDPPSADTLPAPPQADTLPGPPRQQPDSVT